MFSAPNEKKARSTAPLKEGFFRAASRMLRTHRIGDLLVDSGLISSDQLKEALAEQKRTGERLGKILIREKAVSPAQLYKKLAEQWCMKASAAGIALVMQVTIPAPAYADFMQASARTVKAPAPRSELFGAAGIRSRDISPFKKWTGMIGRYEEETKNISTTAPRAMLWRSALRELRGRPQREQIEAVNSFVNQSRYIEDIDNYGVSDYWATPIEFLSRGGDCEDFAIAKYASLRALGFSEDQLRLAIVHDKLKGIDHAILIVYSDDGNFVLDNQDKKVESADDVNRYRPIFSLNNEGWWLYKTNNV